MYREGKEEMSELSVEQKREIARKIVRIRKQIKKIDSALAPYRKNETIHNNIYKFYQDNGKIGQMLRMKDRLILKRHELEVSLGIRPKVPS